MTTPADHTENAEVRRAVRNCIGETIPLRRRWVSAIIARVVGPLLDDLATLREENRLLRGERDEARARASEVEEAYDSLRETKDRVTLSDMSRFHRLSAETLRADDAEAQAATLAERVKALEATLRPFSEAADDLFEADQDSGHLWESPAAIGLTAGDLRAARSALSQPTRTDGGGDGVA